MTESKETPQGVEVAAEESAPIPPMGTSEIQLPSRGVLYDGKLPEGRVLLRPMTTQEEKVLISPQQDRFALLDKVLDKCLVTRDVPLEDMLVTDKLYLLLALRDVTYGSQYSFRVTCRRCGSEQTVEMALPESLETTVLTPDDVEPFEVDLPVCGKKVDLRLLRVKDETEVLRWTRRKSLKRGVVDEGDPAYIYRLSRHIVAIDGEEASGTEALSFCETLVGKDSLAIRTAIEEHDCGVELILEHTCSRCGHSYEELMPFTNDFFRPGFSSRRQRE